MSLWWCPGPVGDGNPCTVDVCLPFFGDFYFPRAAGTTCGDGDACDGADVCNGNGACVASAPVPTDDGNPCTVDACDAELGVSHEALPDGSECSSDDNACTIDSCMQGVCEHAAIACDDHNGCTTDACDFNLGCVATPNVGQACDDGDACTVADACDDAGHCASGGALHCDDGAFCNGAETCDASAGCVAGTAPVVDDGVGCTTDSCDEDADVVVHAPDDVVCDDGDACTGVDYCSVALGCQVSGPFACGLAFTSQPVTSVLVGSWSLPPQPVDFRRFTVANIPTSAPNWVISADGVTATQTKGGTGWTYLVSDYEVITERFETDLTVTPNDLDDDFIGIAWGYQDSNHNYLMDWKAFTQAWHSDGTSALLGLSVRRIDNPTSNPWHYSYPGGYGTSPELYFHAIRWQPVTAYHMTVDIDPGLATTRTTRNTNGAVQDTTTIIDGKYLTGRVALYSYEQANTRFANARRTVRAHSDYVYDATVSGVDAGEHVTYSLVDGPAGMRVDPETGHVFWQMSVRSAGVHAITLRAEDGAGDSAEQSFMLEVVDAGPCYQAPAGPPCTP